MRFTWLVFLLLPLVKIAGQITEEPRLNVDAEDYVVGPVSLRARLEPAETPFVRAEFFVDDMAVCRLDRLPLTCAYDAGQGGAARRVRVFVTLPNGRRLSAGFESKELKLEDSTGVRNVLVPVVVRDWRGRFMSGLKQDSFLVFEDGVAQSVQFFMAENVPLDLTLALDISASTAPILSQVKAAAHQLMARLKPNDRVSLVAFNERVHVLARPDADPAERAKQLNRLEPQGGTALIEAMVRGIELLVYQGSRKAMIVFTDGKDQHSRVSIDAVEKRLIDSDVAIYLVTYGRGSPVDNVRLGLAHLAERTGGRNYRVEHADDINFTQIIDDLSEHYLLGYSPIRPPDDTLRRIDVELKGKSKREYEIRSRSGYRAVASAKQ